MFDTLRRHLAGSTPKEVDDPELAQAAVALIVAPDPLSILFIRRATRQGDPWSGQMALPGGRKSREDPDLRTTAVRETMEEVTIALTPDRYLGQLDDVAPRTPELPPLMVRPFVFWIPSAVTPQPCGREVDQALWLSLDLLSGPGVYQAVTLQLRGGERVFPGYRIGAEVVWGMTERIITPLLRAVELIP